MTFAPHLTPEDMLTAGVFGGNYFARASEEDFDAMRRGIVVLAERNCGVYRTGANKYVAKAGETYDAWMRNGWIFDEDPLGWFHWYCRYASGRRHERDDHQIARWSNYGKRWGRFARTQLHTKGDASNVVKQGLLQWSYSPMRILHGDEV